MLITALLLLASAPAAPAAAAPASAPAGPGPRPESVFTVTVSGETGSLLELSAGPGLDAAAWTAFKTATQRDGERKIEFRLVFEERWSTREGGGWRATRALREATVRRTVSGGDEAAPLPGDYATATETIDLDAAGLPVNRQFAGSRLPAPEIEMISQFLALEPFPAPPAGLACDGRFSRDEGAPWYRILDTYAPAPPAKGAPCDPRRLTLQRDIAVAADPGPGAPALRTAGPALFLVTARCDGLPAEVDGGFEFGFSESFDAPPELLVPTKPGAARKPAGSAPAAAPKISIRYRLPTRFRVQRIAAEGGDTCR